MYNKKGKVIWITGLSGSGKTTIAKQIKKKFKENHLETILLDGDRLRKVFNSNNDYDRKSRLLLARQYSNLGKILSDQGFTVIISTISLFQEIHAWNRENLKNYFEIFLNIPIKELKSRDTKSLYKDYHINRKKNIAGLDLKIDIPKNPNITVSLDQQINDKLLIDKIFKKIQTT